MAHQGEDSIKVHLPGRRHPVDVCTRDGAHAFVTHSGEAFNFFSSNLASVNEILSRQSRGGSGNGGGGRSRRFTPQERQLLEITYAVPGKLAANVEQDVFAKIPNGEIECLIDHVTERFEDMSLSGDRQWKRSGVLKEKHDVIMISSMVFIFMHRYPTRYALFESSSTSSFFAALSRFVSSCRNPSPSLPCNDITEGIAKLVSNAIITIYFDQTTTSAAITGTVRVEKAFKKLESSGMLHKYIRCTTLSPLLIGNVGITKVYDELIACTAFLQKKFKPGQPCGDTIAGILNGRDCSLRNTDVINRLKTISSLVGMVQKQNAEGKENEENFERLIGRGMKICRYCNRSKATVEFQASLMLCSRCKNAYYCSKECQKKDWKSHKLECIKVTKSESKTSDANQAVALSFVRNNYLRIMEKLVEVIDETGSPKSELLLEFDFKTPSGGGGGVAPALRDPPEFKIGEVRGYLEGSRPNEPDWFFKNGGDDDLYRKNVNSAVTNLRKIHQRLTNNELLCFVRSSSMDSSVYKIRLQESKNGNHMLSNEAVKAFRSAIQDAEFGPLSRIFTEDNAVTQFMRRKYGGEILPDDDIDLLRRLLNSKFGAQFPLSDQNTSG